MMEAVETQDGSPWRSGEAARGLNAWSERQLAELACALGRAICAWRDTWGLPGQISALCCEPASSDWVLGAGWRAMGEGDGAAWLRMPEDSAASIVQMLFDTAGTDAPAALEVARSCERDGWKRLAHILQLPQREPADLAPPAGLGLPWSGAVQVALHGTPGWGLLLAPQTVRAWCRAKGLERQHAPARGAREPLCCSAQALAARTLSLNVELAGCEMELGTLQTLQVGDVVRLRHGLDSPAHLTDASGKKLFDGFLLAQEGRKALELVQPPSR
jgi:hypothetical protein